MECVVPLGHTNKATFAVSDRTGLTGELWLSMHFNEHTMAAFLFKCMEEPAFGSLPAPTAHPTPSRPPTHPLYTEFMIFVRPDKSV